MFTMTSSKIYAESSLQKLLEKLEEGSSSGDQPLGDIIGLLLQFAIPLSGICVFALVAMASYKLMTSRGDPDKLKDAKEQITNAVIGFIFILLSVVILVLLGKILNIEIESGY
jgi:hypothetical protein